MEPVLDIRRLCAAYHDRTVLRDVSLTVAGPQLVAVVGPNGAGKSTLLKAALGLVPATAGVVRWFGGRLRDCRPRVAYVPQREAVDWDFPASAFDVALMGTYPRLGWFRRPSRADRTRATACLAEVGMGGLADRPIGQLSGGQQQRVFLARALAQRADAYLLDEPVAGVDAATERVVFDVLRARRAAGCVVVAVHHDLRTVPAYFDRAILLNVRVVSDGPAGEMADGALRETYGDRLPAAEVRG